MSSVSVTIRMDAELKKRFETLCDELGMNLTTAFTVFAKAAVRENGFPVDLYLRHPVPETLEAFEELLRMKADPHMGKTYSTAEEMMKELLS